VAKNIDELADYTNRMDAIRILQVSAAKEIVCQQLFSQQHYPLKEA